MVSSFNSRLVWKLFSIKSNLTRSSSLNPVAQSPFANCFRGVDFPITLSRYMPKFSWAFFFFKLCVPYTHGRLQKEKKNSPKKSCAIGRIQMSHLALLSQMLYVFFLFKILSNKGTHCDIIASVGLNKSAHILQPVGN